MAKRRISAKEAVVDIRGGMDDPTLMKKYGLSSEGLQSLLDKLVQAGFIDLGEVENRLPGVLGTVVVSESLITRIKKGGTDGTASLASKASPLVNAQEAARDIRLGMNDHGLMLKYRLSPKGLQSMFDKLVSAGLITQIDLDRSRRLDTDHTIDLKEEKLSFSDALMQLGLDNGKDAHTEIAAPLPEPGSTDKEKPAARAPRALKNKEQDAIPSPIQEAPRVAELPERAWYDYLSIVMLLLITLFPLGFYALHKNAALSVRTKKLIVVAWAMLPITLAVLFTEVI